MKLNRSFSICSALLSVLPIVQAQPDEVLVGGFKVNVFAEPFDAQYPTALTAAADGTVYVSVDPDGSLGKGRMGKVVSCRDTNGDGKADQFKDFIPEIKYPRGGHFVEGKLYLIHPPFLSVYWDEDGDGVAEKSQQLVDGLGTSALNERGGDHTTNGVRMGIDGWLYIAVGDFGMSSSKGTDGQTVTLHGGGVARVRPDGTELEVYSYHTRNQCDIAISPFLDLFARDNTNDGKGWNIRVHHHTNIAEHGYPRLYKNFAEESVLPLLDLGGGSGTGALYLHEPGFPDDFGDRLFTCDWTTGRIYDHPLEIAEASFVAKQNEWMDLVRAVDIDVDGESRLYTADWRGGGFSYSGDGVKVGKVHRIVSELAPKIEPWPDLRKLDTKNLVAQIDHRSAVRRLEASREILRRGGKPEVAAALREIAAGEAPLYSKVAAIFTLKQLYGKSVHEALIELAKDQRVREFAIRALADRRPEAKQVPSELLREALSDENPRVRLQAAIAIERGKRVELAADLIDTATKAWAAENDATKRRALRVPHTCIQTLWRIGAVEACLKAAEYPRTREVALAALKNMHDPQAVSGLVTLLNRPETDTAARMALMDALARLSQRETQWDEKNWWNTRPDDRGPYFEPQRWEASESAIKAIEKAFPLLPAESQQQMLENIARNRLDVTQLKLGEQDPVLLAIGAQTIGLGQIELLVGGAFDKARKWEQRLASYRTLEKVDEGNKRLKQVALLNRIKVLAEWQKDPSLAEESAREINEFVNAPSLILELDELRHIAKQSSDEISAIAWRAILGFSQSPLIETQQKEAAQKMTLDNPREVGFFLALKELKLEGFDGVIKNAINSDNRILIAAAQEAKAAIAAHQKKDDGKRIAELAAATVREAAMTGKGDPVLGQELYTRQACASCHAVSLEEVQKGPYLGDAGGKFTRDYLIDSVLDPNGTVAQGFVTQLITLKDGSSRLGFITREEDGQVDVRDIGGVVTTLKVADIAKHEAQSQSMMPAGLAAALTVHEFISLIDYLGTLK